MTRLTPKGIRQRVGSLQTRLRTAFNQGAAERARLVLACFDDVGCPPERFEQVVGMAGIESNYFRGQVLRAFVWHPAFPLSLVKLAFLYAPRSLPFTPSWPLHTLMNPLLDEHLYNRLRQLPRLP